MSIEPSARACPHERVDAILGQLDNVVAGQRYPGEDFVVDLQSRLPKRLAWLYLQDLVRSPKASASCVKRSSVASAIKPSVGGSRSSNNVNVASLISREIREKTRGLALPQLD